MPEEDEEIQKAQFFFDYVVELDKVVQKAQESLYQKVKDAITIIVSLITILIGLGNFFLTNYYDISLLFSIGISLIFLSLSVIKGAQILWYRISIYDDPLYMIQKYHKNKSSEAIMITASTWADAVNKNREFYNNKAKGYRWMLGFLGAGLGTLVITFWYHIILLYDC